MITSRWGGEGTCCMRIMSLQFPAPRRPRSTRLQVFAGNAFTDGNGAEKDVFIMQRLGSKVRGCGIHPDIFPLCFFSDFCCFSLWEGRTNCPGHPPAPAGKEDSRICSVSLHVLQGNLGLEHRFWTFPHTCTEHVRL